MRNPEQEIALESADAQDDLNDYLHRLAYEASDQKRCEVLQRMRESGLFIQIVDLESGELLCGSQPLVRVFTISHELIARKLRFDRNAGVVSEEVVESQAQSILNSIQEVIQRNRGIVANKDSNSDIYSEFPFIEFGNDSCVVGLFFPEIAGTPPPKRSLPTGKISELERKSTRPN